jgi:hypothetical protein
MNLGLIMSDSKEEFNKFLNTVMTSVPKNLDLELENEKLTYATKKLSYQVFSLLNERETLMIYIETQAKMLLTADKLLKEAKLAIDKNGKK